MVETFLALWVSDVVFLIVGLALGALFAWLLFSTRHKVREKELETQIRILQESESKFSETFQALSAEALQKNNQSFLELAKTSLEKYQEGAKTDLDKRQESIQHLMKPVRESLDKFQDKIQDLEKARVGAYEGLKEQVKHLATGHQQLRTETTNLVQALRAPNVRGRWGEIQLRRVVEMAGMLNYCDFREQKNVATEDGRLRPDLVVMLPGKKNIVVDAKAPLEAYLDSMRSQDEKVKTQKLQDFAAHIRKHVQELAKKSYWKNLTPTPEFVVLFLPGEHFFSAALDQDPSLLEMAVKEQVILATPTTLIALLKAVAYGWRQEEQTEHAKVIGSLGKEIYERLQTTSTHLSRLGGSIEKCVDLYNKAIGAIENRVLVTARKFKDLRVVSHETPIETLGPIETTTRPLTTPEMTETPADKDKPRLVSTAPVSEK